MLSIILSLYHELTHHLQKGFYVFTLGELYVIIDYCQHGNLQQLLLRNRYLFINQVDPKTGQFDPYGNLRDARKSQRFITKPSK